MAEKRVKVEGAGISLSMGQVDILRMMEAGAHVVLVKASSVSRRFGSSPTSFSISWPEKVKIPVGLHPIRSKNIHASCLALLDKGLIKQCAYQKLSVYGGSQTTYELSEKGEMVLTLIARVR